jgi:hypothetical protein
MDSILDHLDDWLFIFYVSALVGAKNAVTSGHVTNLASNYEPNN